MRDLRNPRWMYLKGALFLVIGLTSGVLLVLNHPDWQTAFSLALSVWAFCRAYYFAFYVVEGYVDPGFRFSGIFSAVRWFLGRPRVRT